MDFVIRYQTGHSQRAVDALSHHPFNPSCDIKGESETDSGEVEVISYSSVCEAIDQCHSNTKVPEDLKQEAQNISCTIQSIIEEEDKDEIVSALIAVSIFQQVTPDKMAEEQQKDPILECIYQWVTASEKHKTLAIVRMKSKVLRKYLLQFYRQNIKKGVLHHLYINNYVEYHQMVLPMKYQAQVLCLLHNNQM